MKIFWSWQSDTPGNTGRHFIRTALTEAIAVLKEPEDVEEPRERENKDAMHLDQDRQGVSGSPDLARTILEKIDASRVFVADVTPVSTIPARKEARREFPEKRNMNPNVAIELGYALRSLTDRNVLMVLNTHYGNREFLPFDLAHKAGPILFELPPDADKAKRNMVASALKNDFVAALRPYLQPLPSNSDAPTFRSIPSTISPVAYYKANEPLAAFGSIQDGDHKEYSYPHGRGFYLRVMPRVPQARPIPRHTLLERMKRAGVSPLWGDFSGLYVGNSHGAIVVDFKGERLISSTQLFANGEIWAVSLRFIVENEWGKFVPCQAFEAAFRNRLRDYVLFLGGELNISPPYSIEAGAVGIKGIHIVHGSQPDDTSGPIFDDVFQVERILHDASQTAVDHVALAIFEGLFGTTGYPRPKGLYGFPP